MNEPKPETASMWKAATTALEWDKVYSTHAFPFGQSSPLDNLWPPDSLHVDPGLALEICSGYGRHQSALKRYHSRVLAVDFSIEAARLLASRVSAAEAICADVRMLPFQDDLFRVIYCISDPSTIQGLLKSFEVVNEVRRTLCAQGGTFLALFLQEPTFELDTAESTSMILFVMAALETAFQNVTVIPINEHLTALSASR